jgi:hypothetical protein
MQMIVVVDIKAAAMVVEGVSRVLEASLAKENQGKRVALVVLGSGVMRTVKLACTTVVHLVVVPINLVQVKNTLKKVLVRVVLVQDRVKIALQEVNLGVNLVRNSQNPVKL